MDFTVTKTLTDGDVENIITTAVEGGIGYWACLLNDDPDWVATGAELQKEKAEGKIEDFFYCTIIKRIFENGKSVKMVDAEDQENSKVWEINLAKFKSGCALYERERGSIKKCIDDGNFDAVEADCLWQYATFGEIIFG